MARRWCYTTSRAARAKRTCCSSPRSSGITGCRLRRVELARLCPVYPPRAVEQARLYRCVAISGARNARSGTRRRGVRQPGAARCSLAASPAHPPRGNGCRPALRHRPRSGTGRWPGRAAAGRSRPPR
ncbi:hypothetical protein G6F61_014530 [Rhizopus arrhizus]|nr:hypothetical protein G6F61_014530 [Rhizopus arrhizus]